MYGTRMEENVESKRESFDFKVEHHSITNKSGDVDARLT